jgi:hypothetical protein
LVAIARIGCVIATPTAATCGPAPSSSAGIGSSQTGPGVPQVRLPARMKTFESRTSSPASPIASLMWFQPGFTATVAENSSVSPSISVLMEPPASLRSLLRNWLQCEPDGGLYGLLQLTLLIDTGRFVVPGTMAMF